MSLNDTLRDAAVSHAIGLQRLSRQTERKMVKLLERSERRIVERLQRADITEYTEKRLNKLLDAIRKILSGEYDTFTAAVMDEMREIGVYEAEFQQTLFQRVVPVKLDFVLPTDDQLWSAIHSRPFQGRVLKDWFTDLETTSFARLRNAIRQGFVEGLTTDQIVREVRGTRVNNYTDGILATNRRAAEVAVRTALNHTATQARERTYQRNKNLLKGVQWVSTLDSRTSAVCRGRDGKVYPVDSGPRPPAHPNCRSATTPVVKSWKELGIDLKDAPAGTRASIDGQVPATDTYADWLRRQPVDVQNDILGEKKAILWRKGDLPLDRFTDRMGAEYSLAELRKREREAFERAGL